jgi:hypothetical protein
MGSNKTGYMKDGSRYDFREYDGTTYVTTPGWLGDNSVGSADNSRDAKELAEGHAGSTIDSIKTTG